MFFHNRFIIGIREIINLITLSPLKPEEFIFTKKMDLERGQLVKDKDLGELAKVGETESEGQKFVAYSRPLTQSERTNEEFPDFYFMKKIEEGLFSYQGMISRKDYWSFCKEC